MAKKSTKKYSVAQMVKMVEKAKPGFSVLGVRGTNELRTYRDTSARSRKNSGAVIGTPDLLTLKKKYGLAPRGDAVPNGLVSATQVPKTTKGTNQVFELGAKNVSSDRPARTKTLIVSKYTNRPVSGQG